MRTHIFLRSVLPSLSLSQNFHLATHIASKQLTFIDAPSILDALNGDGASLLKDIYERITLIVQDVLEQRADSSLDSRALSVIVQDLSHLAWIGVKELDITRFYRAIRGFCLKVCPSSSSFVPSLVSIKSNGDANNHIKKRGISLILTGRILAVEPPGAILRDLLSNNHLVIDVLPLSSGRSGAVSGEVWHFSISYS